MPVLVEELSSTTNESLTPNVLTNNVNIEPYMETLSKADAAKEEKAKPIYTGPRLESLFWYW
jgi:hypothetical protein